MADIKLEDANELDFVDNAPENKLVGDDATVDGPKHSDVHEENPIPFLQEEEEIIKKKYGGILPKKPPLISKDHERAFFDSADWALGKQGTQKTKGPLEALRPKLQPSQHEQLRSRRSAYAPADETKDENHNDDTPSKDQSCELEVGGDKNANSRDESFIT